MRRTAQAVIDLSALRHNFYYAKQVAPESKVMAVVKANAYGHGLPEVAEALQMADGFAVANMSEALLLREVIHEKSITVFQGVLHADQLTQCVEQQLWPVIHDEHQLSMLAAYPGKGPLNIWLKLNTGMCRLGFACADSQRIYQQLKTLPFINNVRLMTHMACADEGARDNGGFTTLQANRFDKAVKSIAAEHSLANSATLLAWPHLQRHWVRPGIMLYGASPFITDNALATELKPVMRLESRLIAINHCKQGERVGYGAKWLCPQDMSVGVVAIGYGDGYPRHAKAGTPVLIRGQRVPLIGRVSMDMITIDLSTVVAEVGDKVVLWGKDIDGTVLTAEEVAAQADTIAYELYCGVYGRVSYLYQG